MQKETPLNKLAAIQFQTAKGSVYVAYSDGTTMRNKAYRPEHGEADQGIKPVSDRTIYLDSEGMKALVEFGAKGLSRKSIALFQGSMAGIRYTSGPRAGTVEKRTVTHFHTLPAVGLTPVELWDEGRKVHFGNPISKVSIIGS